MSRSASDAQVLVASVDDPVRFAALWERHAGRVRRYLARRIGGDLAEDLTGEVFVRAFRARGSYRALSDSALPWLLGIASHVVADHRRAERRRFEALSRLASENPPAIVHQAAGLAPELLCELRRLPQVDRDTLLLVVWGELSYEETAGALGVPVGTVRSRIARARSRLAGALELAGDGRHELGMKGNRRG